MRDVLNMIAEMLPEKENLSDNEIVEIYKATTEEERVMYMRIIENLLERHIVPEDVPELCMAVSYLNIEAYIYKNWLINTSP